MTMFRDLKASEIDCRIAQINAKGLSLLLYKDARVDQNILDETVTPYNWQRKQEMIGGNLYCTVSIYDSSKGEWISKQDVGTESYTEKEKGQASDAFKRACFNWGIGRELYTAPFIWVDKDKCNIKTQGGKQRCYNNFYVSNIVIEDKIIKDLEISISDYKPDEKAKKQDVVVYTMNRKDMPDKDVPAEPAQEETAIPGSYDTRVQAKRNAIEAICKKHKFTPAMMCEQNGLDWETLTEAQVQNMLDTLMKKYGDA